MLSVVVDQKSVITNPTRETGCANVTRNVGIDTIDPGRLGAGNMSAPLATVGGPQLGGVLNTSNVAPFSVYGRGPPAVKRATFSVPENRFGGIPMRAADA
jgi:hypothetical protein